MNFVLTICLSGAAAAVFRILVPENKLSQQMSVLIAGAFVLTCVTAVIGADISLEPPEAFYEAEYTDISENANAALKEKICRETERDVREFLAQRGCFPEKISMVVNISGMYGIDISEIELVTSGSETDEAACRALSEEMTGIKITAVKGEENE